MSNSIGDLKNSGLQGNNWPWQYRVLLGLDGILNALQSNGEDFEAAYVVEKCPGPPPTERVLLEVRIWDTTTNTWGTIRYYLPGSNTPIAGPVPAAGCTLEYVDASNIRPLTCADEITVCGTSFTDILGVNALNVNVVNPIPLEVIINEANDSILVYGNDGAVNRKIKTDVNGELQVDVLTMPATFAEDSAHVSGNTGSFVLGVRNDFNAEMTDADGDYSPIAVNNRGAVAIQDGGGSITVDGGTGVQRTPTFLRPTGSNGTVSAGTYSMSFASVGTGNATVGSITLKPGETLNFDAGAINNTLGAVNYSTTTAGAELIIITLT